MGKVHYKFVYNDLIDFPKEISFNTYKAVLQKKEDAYEIEGDVGKTDDVIASPVSKKMDDKEFLKIYVKSSGRATQTWTLTVSYTDTKGTRKLIEPIQGTILSNGYLIIHDDYELV